MEYPELCKRIEKTLSNLERELGATRLKLEKTLGIVESRENTMENKMGFFERYTELSVSDPKEAEAFWSKKKLGISQNRLEAVRQLSVQLREKIGHLENRRKDLRADLARLAIFSPIQRQVENPVVQREFVVGPNKTRKPNCKFSTFEHLFAPFDHRLTPRNGSVPWDSLSVEHCIADPRLIPDAFIEEMGLAELPLGLTEVQKLARKADAIPRLKRLFREAEPMKRYSRRGDLILNPRLLIVRRFGPDQDGKILHAHFRGEGDEKSDRKVLQVFDCAYAAYRKTLHVDRRYENETSLILQAEERILGLNRRLSSIRKNDPDAETLKAEIRMSLAKEAAALAASRNHFKHSAAQALASIVDIKDRLGRENPGATCARLLKVIGFVKCRTPEIFNKSQFGAEDKQSLREAIERSEAVFGQLIDTFKAIHSRLETPKRIPENPKENKALVCRQRDYILRNISDPLLTIPPLRPFSLYTAALSPRIERLLSATTYHNRNRMNKAVRESLGILRIFVLQAHFERLLAEASVPKDLNTESLRRMAAKARDLLKSPSSSTETMAWLTTKKTMNQIIDDFFIVLDRAQAVTQDPEAQKRRQLRTILDAVDFTEYLKAL